MRPESVETAAVVTPVMRPYVSIVKTGTAAALPYVPELPGLKVTVGRSVAEIVTHEGVDEVSLRNFSVAVEFGARRVPVPLAPP